MKKIWCPEESRRTALFAPAIAPQMLFTTLHPPAQNTVQVTAKTTSQHMTHTGGT